MKPNSISSRWATHKLRIITLQRFSDRPENSKPHIRPPGPGVQHWEKNTQSIWLWRPVEFDFRSLTGLQELHRIAGNRAFTTKGSHRISCVQGPIAKVAIWWNPGLPALVLESLLRRWGQLWLTLGTKTLVLDVWGSSPGSCHLGTKTWPHLTASRRQC